MYRHVWCCLLGCLFACSSASRLPAAQGELELTVIDESTGEPTAAQILLENQRGKPVHPPKLTKDGLWNSFDGTTVLRLPPGNYTFRLQRGAEFKERSGQFSLRSGAADHQEVTLPRFVSMSGEGWWAGDPAFQPRAAAGIGERLLAADLHFLAAATQRNGSQLAVPARYADQVNQAIGATRHIHWQTGCDRRPTGTLWLLPDLAHTTDLQLPKMTSVTPSPHAIAAAVRATGGVVHLDRVTNWSAPVWIALGSVDTAGVLHGGLIEHGGGQRDTDRSFDAVFFPGPHGPGRWAQHVYFQFLEAGIRLAPAAGSDADVSGNRLGFHRTYAHCGDTYSPAHWLAALREGRTVLTNGPLLRPTVNGQLPGHTFRAESGEKLSLEVALSLSTAQPIQYLEIIQNGRSVQQVRLQDWAAAGGRLPAVEFDASGWLLIRAVADDETTYRCAMSAPFYVEFAGQPRRSKQATTFMLEWLDEFAQRFPKFDDGELKTARLFWEQQAANANAD
ncbi:MAG: CehA/McbA family metallohydrolase [Planctomycetales bacterium]|nr:CehA/McbA family metallohydrolase [Planctomycetales bacterium]